MDNLADRNQQALASIHAEKLRKTKAFAELTKSKASCLSAEAIIGALCASALANRVLAPADLQDTLIDRERDLSKVQLQLDDLAEFAVRHRNCAMSLVFAELYP